VNEAREAREAREVREVSEARATCHVLMVISEMDITPPTP
jgi:hypothetical protein